MFRPEYKRAIVCRYLSFYDPHLKKRFRLPLVHIRIKHSRNTIRTDALVDSGATTTFIPIELTEVLGIELPEETSEAIGANGSFPIYRVKIDLIEVLKSRQSFCRFKDICVSIPAKKDSIPYPVLGRDSIFRCYDITFRENREHIVFKRPKK